MRWWGRKVDRFDQGDDARCFRDEARAAMAAGKLDEAIEALGQAALLRPGSADLHVELGALFQRAGRVEAARQAYERALDVDPSHQNARVAARALPPEPPKRSNFAVGELLQGARGTAGGGITQYQVLDVRRGGFGAVYVVKNVEDNERVALKSFDARLLWNDEDRRRFLIEATTWISLDPHPNVVTARSVELIEGFPCLVMDYVDGGDLGDRLAKGPLSARTAVDLGIQLCDGMEHARSQLGLVHRDLKPSNCMLTRRGTLKVTDFGLARALRYAQETSLGLSERHTSARALYSTVAGTPAYMAPEQFELGARLDTRTDVFAFGIMLYQLLSGQLPPIGRRRRHLDRWRTSGRASRDLVNLIRDCADPDPDRRPATFGEVRGQLGSVYRGLTMRAVPSPPLPGKVSPYTWVDRSVGFRHLGMPDQALTAADRGLTIAATGDDDVVRGRLWQVRGLALVDLDRRVEALDSYDRALEFTPEEPSTWVCKGGALSELGRDEEALSCYDHCLGIAPDYPMALRNKAASLDDLGRPNEAEAMFRRAAERIPRDVELLANWSGFLRRQGRYDEALQRIEQALEIAPRYSYGWRRLGTLLTAMEQVDDGLAAYDRSLEIDPRDVRTWVLRGDALAAADRTADALACYDQALTLDPQYRPAQEMRERLLS
ncbi:tetratricopeptide repeat protein [Nonomuraea sp. 10N515B]|uniref:tetratricopeptide repeat protein n=1 Tax=Nonomuraea sp. 10N515B TaxID=3457422 RepID=UPI003FCCEF8A